MAAPVLQNVTATASSGTSFSVSASATSPQNGDYRIMVVVYDARYTLTPPSGWEFLHTSIVGTEDRAYVYGQVWTPSTTTGSIQFSVNAFWTVTLARVSGYTLGGPIVAGPVSRSTSGRFSTTALALPSLLCQADSLRIDFWSAYYSSGATSANLSAPVGQSSSALMRSGSSTGYITRASWETFAGYGYSGSRTATYTSTPNAVGVAVVFGGWKVADTTSTTTLDVGSSSVMQKAITEQTTTALDVGPGDVTGGRESTGATTTSMGLDEDAERVHLSRTELALSHTVEGEHVVTGQTTTRLGLTHQVDGHHEAGTVETTTTMRLQSSVAARVGGGGTPPSAVDQFTQQYQPSDKPVRFIFQSIRSGQFLNWDVPLVEPEITHALTGASFIRGRIGPEDNEVVRGIDAWATWLHVEEGGVIRASGIVQPLALQGDDLMIEALGVAGYPIGLPFTEELRAILVDPAEIMRQLWAILQIYPDAKLGVTVSATSTPRRLGSPSRIDIERDELGEPLYRTVTVDEATGRVRVNQDDVPPAAFNYLIDQGYQLYQDTQTGQIVILASPNDLSMATTGLPARRDAEGKWEVVRYRAVEADPYELAWWNEVDVGREIENLARETPFDYAEQPKWATDRLSVQQHIAIGYPRLGTRRNDLRFAEDENLLEVVLLREASDYFASQVIVRGAGEGRQAIRAASGAPVSGRVRRVKSLVDQRITDQARAQEVAHDEVRRRLAATTITEITIDATHDNAPMGSFAVGDDILVQAQLPYYGEVQLWHRITSYTWRPDSDAVVIQLRRSEQFAYGRLVPSN